VEHAVDVSLQREREDEHVRRRHGRRPAGERRGATGEQQLGYSLSLSA